MQNLNFLNPYFYVIKTRNFLFDKKVISTFAAQCPVLSIGNITTGGTGKTPLVLYTIDYLQKLNLGLQILVISKSYKAQAKSALEVKSQNGRFNTELFGDEPCLIKSKFPNIHVWSGPNKSETMAKAKSELLKRNIKVGIVIVDDGFSHRKIERNLDIVLIDVSQNLTHYNLIPFGHLRESLDSLKRADLVILTKTNTADAITFDYFKNYLKQYGIPFIKSEFNSQITTSEKKLFLFSGLGHPDQLEKSLKNQNFSVVQHLKFADHVHYTEKIQLQILEKWKKSKDLSLVTTEKDFIKLTDPDLIKNCQIISLKVSFTIEDGEVFNEKISQIL